MEIKKIHIKNFKSLVDVELINPNAFSVFVGSNGAGKSNIFEALEYFIFTSPFIQKDSKEIIDQSQYEDKIQLIEPYFGNRDERISMLTENEWCAFYILSSETAFHTFSPKTSFFKNNYTKWEVESKRESNNFSKELDEFRKHQPFRQTFESADFCRINLNHAFRIPNRSDKTLQSDAANLEKVLKRLLLDEKKRNEIVEWMQILIPEFKDIQIETSELSGTESLVIFEKATGKPFPKHLISDGTKNILALLTSVFQSDEPQFLCIEEPENGLNPFVVKELVNLFRHACEQYGHAIWLNTHSQTLVSQLTNKEIILVDKKAGETKIKQIQDVDLHGLKMDDAWLTNALNGGLPW